MTAKDREQESDWLKLYRVSAKSPPMDTLTRALSLFDAEPSGRRRRFAIDLGCGAGRDTPEPTRSHPNGLLGGFTGVSIPIANSSGFVRETSPFNVRPSECQLQLAILSD